MLTTTGGHGILQASVPVRTLVMLGPVPLGVIVMLAVYALAVFFVWRMIRKLRYARMRGLSGVQKASIVFSHIVLVSIALLVAPIMTFAM